MKKILAAATLAMASVALPSHAALVASWDVFADMSGETVASGFDVTISGGGGGGTATLDSNGTFSLSGLNSLGLNLHIGNGFGGANLNLAANGNVIGTYDSLTQQLSGNTGTLNVSQNSCAGYGGLQFGICGAIPGAIDFSNPFVLTSANGLTDPITFDLVNDFSFLLGELGGAVAVELNLSNVQVSAVPLPAAAWLFSSALLGLAGLARKRRVA